MLDACHFLQVANADGITPQTIAIYLNGLTTQSSSYNTAAHYIGDAGEVALAFSCPSTGSPVGSIKLQVSNDVSANQQVGMQFPDAGLVNWADVVIPSTGSASVAVSGSTGGPLIWVFKRNGFRWARFVVTLSSGTIAPTATIESKR